MLKSKFFQILRCWFSEKWGNHLQIQAKIYRTSNKFRKSGTNSQLDADLNGRVWLISKVDIFQREPRIYSNSCFGSKLSPPIFGVLPFFLSALFSWSPLIFLIGIERWPILLLILSSKIYISVLFDYFAELNFYLW